MAEKNEYKATIIYLPKLIKHLKMGKWAFHHFMVWMLLFVAGVMSLSAFQNVSIFMLLAASSGAYMFITCEFEEGNYILKQTMIGVNFLKSKKVHTKKQTLKKRRIDEITSQYKYIDVKHDHVVLDHAFNMYIFKLPTFNWDLMTDDQKKEKIIAFSNVYMELGSGTIQTVEISDKFDSQINHNKRLLEECNDPIRASFIEERIAQFEKEEASENKQEGETKLSVLVVIESNEKDVIGWVKDLAESSDLQMLVCEGNQLLEVIANITSGIVLPIDFPETIADYVFEDDLYNATSIEG